MKNRVRWTLGLFLFVVVGGASLQARGALIPTFKAKFLVSDSILGLVSPALASGFAITILIFGMFAGKINIKKFILLLIIVHSIFLGLIGTSPIFLVLLAFMFGRGIASGGIRALDRIVLSHLYPLERGRIFNLQELAWSIGAVLGPLYVNLVLILGNWRMVYYSLGLMALPALVFLWGADPPENIENENPITLEEIKSLLRDPAIITLIMVLIIDGCIENAFFTWLPYYSNLYFSESFANVTLSIFLSAYIPGRFFYSIFSEKWGYTRLIMINSLISTPFMIFTFVLSSKVLMLVSIFVTGFLVSGVVPTMIAWAVDAKPKHTGPINALGMMSINIGFVISPPIIGLISDLKGIKTAMSSIIILPILLFLVLAITILKKTR